MVVHTHHLKNPLGTWLPCVGVSPWNDGSLKWDGLSQGVHSFRSPAELSQWGIAIAIQVIRSDSTWFQMISHDLNWCPMIWIDFKWFWVISNDTVGTVGTARTVGTAGAFGPWFQLLCHFLPCSCNLQLPVQDKCLTCLLVFFFREFYLQTAASAAEFQWKKVNVEGFQNSQK